MSNLGKYFESEFGHLACFAEFTMSASISVQRTERPVQVVRKHTAVVRLIKD